MTERVAQTLADFVDAAWGAIRAAAGPAWLIADIDAERERFRRRARQGDRLARLRWAAGQALDGLAASVRRLAGLSSAPIEQTVEALLGVGAHASPGRLIEPLTVPTLLLRSAAPDLSTDDLLHLIRLADHPGVDPGRLAPLCDPAAPPFAPRAATQDGVERAQALRQRLHLADDRPLLGPDDLEHTLLPRLGVTCLDIQLSDPRTDGAAVWTPGRPPIIAINRGGLVARTPWGRRMTIAHELCHLLHDQDAAGQVGTVSNGWATYRLERRANAFAVTLLAPEGAIRAHLPGPPRDWQAADLQRTLVALGVGRSTLLWQLTNLGLLSETERRAWLDQLWGGRSAREAEAEGLVAPARCVIAGAQLEGIGPPRRWGGRSRGWRSRCRPAGGSKSHSA